MKLSTSPAIPTYLMLLLFLLHFTGCSTVSDQEFSVSNWKSASHRQRRYMAEDFLKKYQTRGMTVDQIKVLLGDPDFGSDSWRYNLNLDGPTTSQQQDDRLKIENQYFWVIFQGLHVQQIGITNRQDFKDGLRFESTLWKTGDRLARAKMAASLVNSDILKGRKKDEAREILGEPDGESEKEEIEYNLGLRMIDYETLTFRLDANGRVREARIIEH